MRKTVFAFVVLIACSDQEAQRPDWLDVSSWVYQLQPSASQSREDFIGDIARTGFNLAVIDYSYDGTADEEFTPDEIGEIKSSGKFVLCYISIGEAEDYRWYWDPSWGDDLQDPAETERVLSNLRVAKAGGKLVLIVDYCREPEHIEDLYRRARAEGFVPYSTVRGLDSLVINPQDP